MAKKIDKPDGKETLKHEKNEKIRGKKEKIKEGKFDGSLKNAMNAIIGKKKKH